MGRSRAREGTVNVRKSSLVFLAAIILLAVAAPSGWAKRKKKEAVSPNDPTYKLYQLLDNSFGGTLSNFYLLAGVYKDPQKPANQLQRVILVDYHKGSYFGRFRIYVRSVGKLTRAQLKTYNTKQIYQFAESDDAEFEKINPGPLGGTGDLYLKATSNGPLAPAPITDEVRQQYNTLITKYILPALKKKK